MNTLKKIRANQKGFTLVELIVVVAILGVLAAVAAPNYMNYLYKSRVNADISSARAVLNAARTMYMTTNATPELEAVLKDADMTNTVSASGDAGQTLGDVLSEITMVEITDGDEGAMQFQVTLEAAGKAGKYAGSYTIYEYDELPTPAVGGC